MAMAKLDLIGKKINRWNVLEYAGVDKHSKTLWRCQCSCKEKTIRIISGSSLATNKTKSCGCYQKEKKEKQLYNKDYIGKTINGIKIIRYYGKNKNKRQEYLCLCKCGRYFRNEKWRLVNKKTKNCGRCRLLINEMPELIEEWDFEKNKSIDINNLTFSSHKKVWWICKKCNKNWKTVIKNRTNNKTGCPRCCDSKGNKRIEEILYKLNIKFEKEKRFEKCRDKNTLPFDFYLPDYNICIEYQGIQHYKEQKVWGKFEDLKRRDKIKKDFCINNNKHLLEIKYTKYNKIENIIKEKLNII
jgi:hypothetical protein